MASFVHVHQPTSHPGVERAGNLLHLLETRRSSFSGARGVAALALSAIVSALLVAADRLMATSHEDGLLLGWLVLWTVAFVAIGFFAGTAQRFGQKVNAQWTAFAQRQAAARADARFMEVARHDDRMLRDLKVAAIRQESQEAEPTSRQERALQAVAARSADAKVPTLQEAMRRVNRGQYY